MSLALAPENPLGAGVRTKLNGFAQVLRDNGFILGLAETRDALTLLASGDAARPSGLRSALKSLFCSRQSDWQKFDELFDAFWLQRGMKSATRISGAPQTSPPGLQTQAAGPRSFGESDQADHVERGEGSETSESGNRDGKGRREPNSCRRPTSGISPSRKILRRRTGLPNVLQKACAPG